MDDAICLEDGLVVYAREGIYQMRLRVSPQRYIWRSLKTRDKEQAIRTARREFYKLEIKKEEGEEYAAPTLKKVLADYLKQRELENKRGDTKDGMLRQIKRVQKFWLEYAGNKPVDKIGDKELAAFVDWRKAYYGKLKELPQNAKLHPTDKTLQWELTFGKSVLKWAHSKGYRGKKPLPTYSFVPKVKRVRPAFQPNSYRKLYSTLRQRVNAARHTPKFETRLLLRDYVLILANSGMRVGELNNVKIGDVTAFTDEKDRKNYRIVVGGKTGQRDVILRASAKNWIDRVLARRKEQGAKDNDYLFVMPSGRKIITLADQFNEALKEAEIVESTFGEKFTLYSLRHFYAVMALRKHGVFEVARNMGTSVPVINAYYGKHATSKTFATKLGD